MTGHEGGSKTVGRWYVEVSPLGVIAGPLESGATYTTTTIRFPIGWRVGKVWSNGVASGPPEIFGIPRRVVSAAAGIARQMQ
ncbi:hypothetical protein [Microbacterium sp. bgisy189]|uniref:hypothetical protein n=1 Tax=Microbacterium sp. bgisy189 TaxID=3413798 RepID=UPI003EC0A301